MLFLKESSHVLASGAVLSTDQVHCDNDGREAFFGGGTKLTVLGKK